MSIKRTGRMILDAHVNPYGVEITNIRAEYLIDGVVADHKNCGTRKEAELWLRETHVTNQIRELELLWKQ